MNSINASEKKITSRAASTSFSSMHDFCWTSLHFHKLRDKQTMFYEKNAIQILENDRNKDLFFFRLTMIKEEMKGIFWYSIVYYQVLCSPTTKKKRVKKGNVSKSFQEEIFFFFFKKLKNIIMKKI